MKALLRFTFAIVFLMAPSIAFAQWQPPIGIPAPPWGITQIAPAAPSPWAQEVPGFYYVDSTAVGSTDSTNPYGWPGKPRNTIPNVLPAGSVVELHGTYSQGHNSPRTLVLNGTSTAPVFLRGVSVSNKPIVLSTWEITGTYFIVENIEFAKEKVFILAPTNFGAFRNSEVHGTLTSGGMAIASWTPGLKVTNLVVSGNKIHDNGDVNANFDQDISGIHLGWNGNVDHVWILDNELYRNSGDGISVVAGNISAQPTVHHIYVGRNVSHHNKQTGMWSKQSVDVIFSQNTVYGHRAGNSSGGAGMGFQYGPERIWFIFNHSYDNEFGISAGSDNDLGTGTSSYFIGNVIHNIHAFSGRSGDSAWSNAAFTLAGGVNRRLVDNTMYDVDGGIYVSGGGTVFAANNIIAGLSYSGGRHVFLEQANTAAASTLKNTLFGEAPRLSWGSSAVFTSLASFQSATGQGLNTLVSDPKFVNSLNGDFHLLTSSPAINGGVVDDVYNTFQTLYGINIRKAADGVSRPLVGQSSDVGAYQMSSSSTGQLSAPTTLRIVP